MKGIAKPGTGAASLVEKIPENAEHAFYDSVAATLSAGVFSKVISGKDAHKLADLLRAHGAAGAAFGAFWAFGCAGSTTASPLGNSSSQPMRKPSGVARAMSTSCSGAPEVLITL